MALELLLNRDAKNGIVGIDFNTRFLSLILPLCDSSGKSFDLEPLARVNVCRARMIEGKDGKRIYTISVHTARTQSDRGREDL